MYNKLTKPNLGPQTAKLYQHGFRLLEEQLGTYIKEYYSGVEKIDGDGNEVIELKDSNGKFIDVSNEQHLPNEVKLTRQPFIDGNIELLVEDGQLKGVMKNGKGSPTAEIVYNINLSKGD